MNQNFFLTKQSSLSIVIFLFMLGCTSKPQEKADPVEANIKMYTQTWDEIINKGKLDLFNETNFTNDLVMP